ncbi:hypothetical protein AB1283_00775 [Bacillus sp. S13(2024)]|uniref:hypothetical protein n=1 Tax=Bacillus sp. S13(2024) TaxID=3162885 RepID=UPI003D23617D
MGNPFIANKTYLVVGISDQRPDEYRETLYVGQDGDKAKSFTVDENRHTLEMEVWAEGIFLQSYTKKDIHKWVLEFDRMQNMKNELKYKQEELKEMEEQISKLKLILGIE